MRTVKPTPKTMYLYNPYFEMYFDIIKPMPRFKRMLEEVELKLIEK